ncbi:MAG: 4Fe-4S dicluster domain-containing protein, partial [Planctomycetaceae bacterium]
VQALAHAMNEQLGNVGETVVYRPPIIEHPEPPLQSLASLVRDLRAGEVETLIVFGGNPAFTAPADLQFAALLEDVPFSVHLSLDANETSRRCTWHLPATHFLESWSDVRAFEGTASIVQPLIAPLYRGWSAHELLARLMGESEPSSYDIVREHWRQQHSGDDFEEFWRTALYYGVIEEPQSAGDADAPAFEISNLKSQISTAAREWIERYEHAAGAVEVVFRPDPTIWDGRFANNGWLQELPKPFTKLTWDNAALLSEATARRLGVTNEDLVELTHGEQSLRLPAWILPGQPDETVTLHFGYGRTETGRVGRGTGFNVYPLRTSAHPWFLPGVKVRRVEGSYPLATTQPHHLMHGRPIVLEGPVHEIPDSPEPPPFVAHYRHEDQPSLLPEWDYRADADDELYRNAERPLLLEREDVPGYDDKGHLYKWGMVINQTTCVGCNACVVACQAENNIPIVGKEEVIRGREMHWIRIDTYYKGPVEDPETFFQPLPCMHCEKAPCEIVCPVAATTHSKDGLNEMTYNRCIGTRYCSNNCPYKVRRFNFFEYTASIEEYPTLHMLQNPNVTVRSRGVMEKCTYCVQRIRTSQLEAQLRGAPMAAIAVLSACQQDCPVDAIVFGDLNT